MLSQLLVQNENLSCRGISPCELLFRILWTGLLRQFLDSWLAIPLWCFHIHLKPILLLNLVHSLRQPVQRTRSNSFEYSESMLSSFVSRNWWLQFAIYQNLGIASSSNPTTIKVTPFASRPHHFCVSNCYFLNQSFHFPLSIHQTCLNNFRQVILSLFRIVISIPPFQPDHPYSTTTLIILTILAPLSIWKVIFIKEYSIYIIIHLIRFTMSTKLIGAISWQSLISCRSRWDSQLKY